MGRAKDASDRAISVMGGVGVGVLSFVVVGLMTIPDFDEPGSGSRFAAEWAVGSMLVLGPLAGLLIWLLLRRDPR